MNTEILNQSALIYLKESKDSAEKNNEVIELFIVNFMGKSNGMPAMDVTIQAIADFVATTTSTKRRAHLTRNTVETICTKLQADNHIAEAEYVKSCLPS